MSSIRRIWTHPYFEARLEEECLRCTRQERIFCVLRVRASGPGTPDAIEGLLAREVREIDIIASFGPGEYEVLLVETSREGGMIVVARIEAALEAAKMNARVAMVSAPLDGKSPDGLIEQLSAAVRGLTVPPQRPVEAARPTGAGKLDELVTRIAASQISVLILGETGAGKEIFAERIHRRSPRSEGPFLRLNCSALSETLLDSELFGYEKGAFTGAFKTKLGLLETASGGTVFLDEIGDISPMIQVKLLRVLEEREVLRVGGLETLAIDVRFVSATNRDLERDVERGMFRQDLYFRLNGISLFVPPLRERPGEILELARTFLGPGPVLSREAVELLQAYPWPGNVRELRNVMERAVILCGGGPILPEHVSVEKMSARFVEPRRETPAPEGHQGPSLPRALALQAEEYEKRRILDALSASGGNQTEAARMMGISRRTLLNRLEAHGLPRPRKDRRKASS